LLPQKNRKPKINKIKTFSPSLYRLYSSVSSSTTKTPKKETGTSERASERVGDGGEKRRGERKRAGFEAWT
jgi:hypothetical protein